MVLPLLVAMISIAAVAAGVVGGLLLSRRHADAVHRQVEADRDLAIAAAVESVLAERRATVEAVAAERDTTVQKVVETAISVADAKLGDRADASARELDLRSKGFATQVEGINGELHRLGQLVGSLQRERAHQHGQLVEQLQAAATTTQRLTETTQGLRQALASPKARGQWGERMAADVLRSVGLVEGVNYRQQTAIDGGSIPDFTFLLPDGLELNMDVKFPIDNYLRFLDTQGTAEADIARTAFARDVRNR
ncbi:MAG: DNA recombination protein RmuC, partial [Acidimicrobiia bacterium]|nr:DNA recombination protein RmuC [Acidimicrobiia bacterium]